MAYQARKRDRILARVRAGEPLRRVAREERVSESTIRAWIRDDKSTLLAEMLTPPTENSTKPPENSTETTVFPAESSGGQGAEKPPDPVKIAQETGLEGAPAISPPTETAKTATEPTENEREAAVQAYIGLRTLACALVAEFVPFRAPAPNEFVLQTLRQFPRETMTTIEKLTGTKGDPKTAVTVALVIDGLALGMAVWAGWKNDRRGNRLSGQRQNDGTSPPGNPAGA
ncbi:MAG TPA: helix-turn-helix domain-containing protein [Planctomycetota bacterium]|nr:helix-turn-helix domain-containing protein [Planctomycetota bacterium]